MQNTAIYRFRALRCVNPGEPDGQGGFAYADAPFSAAVAEEFESVFFRSISAAMDYLRAHPAIRADDETGGIHFIDDETIEFTLARF